MLKSIFTLIVVSLIAIKVAGKLSFGSCQPIQGSPDITPINYATVFSERWQHLMRDKNENW